MSLTTADIGRLTLKIETLRGSTKLVPVDGKRKRSRPPSTKAGSDAIEERVLIATN
jgi:hypothetical protein